jgi:hypothetical protein
MSADPLTLIPDPILDDSLEANRIAARIYRSIGGLSQQDCALGVQYFTALSGMLGNNWLLSFNCTSFTLTFGDQSSSAAGPAPTTVSLNQAGITAAAIQAALQSLSTVGTNGVTVVSNGDGTYTVTFAPSAPPLYELTGTATGGATTVSATYQPNQIDPPLLPELSSARPAESHIVILTELERMQTYTNFRFNQLPNKVRVGLLRIIGITLIPALAATTTLQFTKTLDFLNIDVTVPSGTGVASLDRTVQVTTDLDLDIPAGTLSATVSATAISAGNIGQIAIGSLGLLLQAIAGIAAVTNTTVLSGGRDAETPGQAKIRARSLMAIPGGTPAGQHLGSVNDWSGYLYYNVLLRLGRVTIFENYLSNFTIAPGQGHMTIVVQDDTGSFPSQGTLNQAAAAVGLYRVAGINVAVTGPQFFEFTLSVNIKITPGVGSAAIIAKATQNLMNWFSTMTFAYGPTYDQNGNLEIRYINLGDIVAQIINAAPQYVTVADQNGVFEITITSGGANYSTDIALGVGQLPLLDSVTLSVVT